MSHKKEWLAMLLAGGQGSRLLALTKNIAKPAVPYGGKYRIIDFTLSNCTNSGIDTVGVLTQYQPLVLNNYIGSGQPWDLARLSGGVHILPPYQTSKGSDWYSGTANAIYQNAHFIDSYSPEYVAILSGDHIYRMDYAKMLKDHKRTNADCTIAVLDVHLDEASRFGIMTAQEDGRITAFEEKPKHPKSTLASMGVYIFSWPALKKYLTLDQSSSKSSHDFGKDIIPSMLKDDQKLFAYRFDGYWKDAGTIDSLWEANMDLLNPAVPLELHDPNWRIYARTKALPPQYIGENAKIINSTITEGCEVDGDISSSILFSDVVVEAGAVVHDSVVMPGAIIKKNAVVEYAIIAEDAVIGEGCHVGARPENFAGDWGIAVIGSEVNLKDKRIVLPNEVVVNKEDTQEVKV